MQIKSEGGTGRCALPSPSIGSRFHQNLFPKVSMFPVGLKLSDRRKALGSTLGAWDEVLCLTQRRHNCMETFVRKPKRQHCTMERAEVLESGRPGRASGVIST